MGESKKGFKPYLGLTFLIGFGFFTMGLMDPLYDTYVPIFLRRYIESMALIGVVMTLDNVLQLFLIPIVSVWSDNTRTRIGRRMPFILVMLPSAALFFGLIPYAAALSLAALVAILFALNLFKTSVRGPVVALMPDTIPGQFRSEANGIINTMGGIGGIVGTLGLARLMDIDITLPILGRTKDTLPFPIAALFVVAAVVVLFVFVRERERHPAEEARVPVLKALKAVLGDQDKSVVYILLSIFFWFMAHEGVKPFLGTYCKDVLGVSSGMAALATGIATVAGVIFAIPAGYIGHRLGRRRVIRACLVWMSVVIVLILLSGPAAEALGLGAGGRLALFWILMFLYGIGWIFVVVNSFPMLWQMASYGTMGVYTGLYYTSSQTAAITAPPITGLLIDLGGYGGVFVFSVVCSLVAFVLMGFVRKGEPEHADTALSDTTKLGA